MNRLDPVSGPLVARPTAAHGAGTLRYGTFALLALAVVLSAGLGLSGGTNPTDRFLRILAASHLSFLLIDLWTMCLAVFRTPDRTPLRIPLKTPAMVGVVRLAMGLWSFYLVRFDVLYRLQPLDELSGIYLIRWSVLLALLVFAAVGFAAAYFEARLVQWVLLSEETAAGQPMPLPDPAGEQDMPLGNEHVYEAQMILHNLGYEVGGIDGEMKDKTRLALRTFQEEARLARTGELSVLTFIELRNRWAGREDPPPGQSVKALSGYLARRVSTRLSEWWSVRRG